MWLIVYSNDHAPLTVRPIYSSSKLRTAQMMIFSLVAMIGLEKCCITSACLQWLCHLGERTVARGPLVLFYHVLSRDKIFLLQGPVVQNICICKSYSYFFSKNTCDLDSVLSRTVKVLTTNELVKLTMLWTTEPRLIGCNIYQIP